MNVPFVAKTIHQLFVSLKDQCDSAEEIAKKINNILLYGEDIPQNIVLAAWDYFAKQKGVENGISMEKRF